MANIWIAATLTFVLAGTVKGVTGMGLPTLSMGLLGLLMAPAEAAALLIIPSLVTNVWQFVIGPNRMVLLRRMWPMLLAICVATWFGTALLIGKGSATRATTALGAVLIVYSAIGLAKFRLALPGNCEAWLSPLIGATTGVVSGATGVFVIPAVPYLQALDLEKEDLVQALGLSFTTSTIALAIGLATHHSFHLAASSVSALCTIPALGGMAIGQWVRARVDADRFRQVFFIGLLVLGADLVIRSFI